MKYEELGDEIKNLVIDTLKTKEISLEGGWCTPDVFSHMQKLVLENTELKKENQELKELLKECRDVAEFTKTIVNKHKWFDEVITKIDEVLK